ncbi:MAG: transcriptional repressor LexA [Clostridiales bacterium]|jgi:repressor LexA|nr:transcriptional repressor LexA [Clostridiales bacterium]
MAKVGLVLDYVNEHIEENGFAPSVREICEALGYKSTSTVHIYLKKLEADGRIIKSPSKPRTLRVIQPPSHADAGGAYGGADNGMDGVHGGAVVSRMAAPGLEADRAGTAAARATRKVPQRSLPQGISTDEDTVYVPVIGRVTAGKPILADENVEYTFPVPSFFVNNADVFMLKVEGDSMIDAGIFDRDYILVRQQPTAQNGEIVVALIDDEATVKTFYREKNRIRLQPQNERYSPIYAKDNCSVVGKVIGIFRKL